MGDSKECSLATELLQEVKAQAKRWFIAFCVMVGLEIFTIIGFMWYISLPTEDTIVTQESDDSSQNTFVGGDNYGGETNSSESKKGYSE